MLTGCLRTGEASEFGQDAGTGEGAVLGFYRQGCGPAREGSSDAADGKA